MAGDFSKIFYRLVQSKEVVDDPESLVFLLTSMANFMPTKYFQDYYGSINQSYANTSVFLTFLEQ